MSPGPAVAATASTFEMERFELAKNLLDQAGKNFDMRSCGNFGHDSAKGLMRRILSNHGLRQNAPVACHERSGAVVAGQFKAKDKSHFAAGPLPHPPQLH